MLKSELAAYHQTDFLRSTNNCPMEHEPHASADRQVSTKRSTRRNRVHRDFQSDVCLNKETGTFLQFVQVAREAVNGAS
jgi:hypothetical protein